MSVFAIDPGNVESAYALIDDDTRRPLKIGKVDNITLRYDLPIILQDADHVALEMVASYGMPVGADVFETCVWIGRFFEVSCRSRGALPDLVFRNAVKVHHCHSGKAKDSNVIQALVDRFAPGVRNKGKGTKAEPGWFFGFHDDIWQAYALAVYVADVGAETP